MNKAPLSVLVLLTGLLLCSAESALAFRPYSPASAKKVRQKAIDLFLAHSYKKSYKCFDDYCLHFPGDTEHLKIELDDAFSEVKKNATEEPGKLNELHNFLDGVLGLTCYMEFRARFPSSTKKTH